LGVRKLAHASGEDVDQTSMTESVSAWQCIGCGRIEAPQTCVGICEYRKVKFVDAVEHEEALVAARAARREADILGALVRRLAHTSPRQGEWERSYKALQQCARRAFREIACETETTASTAASPPVRCERE
jgi:hypothetical protein